MISLISSGFDKSSDGKREIEVQLENLEQWLAKRDFAAKNHVEFKELQNDLCDTHNTIQSWY